ncbi:hypothetical protein M8818_000116 [Zalaria obscura]|uniref:Uncharacterized protein n=1 Tax=Zalaria obscura TaxID=2024903 RepID=A0ACC3SP97_9PEZI
MRLSHRVLAGIVDTPTPGLGGLRIPDCDVQDKPIDGMSLRACLKSEAHSRDQPVLIPYSFLTNPAEPQSTPRKAESPALLSVNRPAQILYLVLQAISSARQPAGRQTRAY